MDEVRYRRPASLDVTAGAVSLTMAACLLVSCSTQASPDQTRPDRAASGSPTAPGKPGGRAGSPVPQSGAEGVLGGLPSAPVTDDAAALARQLERTGATLRDRKAAAGDVRRAGEFQQLAVGTLATAPATFRRNVTRRLGPQTVVVVRGAVRSARLLH